MFNSKLFVYQRVFASLTGLWNLDIEPYVISLLLLDVLPHNIISLYKAGYKGHGTAPYLRFIKFHSVTKITWDRWNHQFSSLNSIKAVFFHWKFIVQKSNTMKSSLISITVFMNYVFFFYHDKLYLYNHLFIIMIKKTTRITVLFINSQNN